MRVNRSGAYNEVRELSAQAMLEGGFDAAHTAGESRAAVATETIKNIAYIVARENLAACSEHYPSRLAARLLERYAPGRPGPGSISEAKFPRATLGGSAHPHSFVLDSDGQPTAVVSTARNEPPDVVSGMAGYDL